MADTKALKTADVAIAIAAALVQACDHDSESACCACARRSWKYAEAIVAEGKRLGYIA